MGRKVAETMKWFTLGAVGFVPVSVLQARSSVARVVWISVLGILGFSIPANGAVMTFSSAVTFSGSTDISNEPGSTTLGAVTWSNVAATINGVNFDASGQDSGQ